jgi:outer membrane protein OmpA-like peptidoglycan-associated protein
MRQSIFLFACVVLSLGLAGQASKAPHDFKHLSDQGDKAYAHGEFDLAIEKFLEANKLSPNNANLLFKIGVTYLSTNKKFEALPYLQKAQKLKKDVNPEIEYYLGHACQELFQFDDALKYLRDFKKTHKRLSAIADEKIEQCLLGKSLMKKKVTTTITLLESPINSKYNDFAPLLDSGETTLVFTSARDTTHRDLRFHNQIFESILISERIGGVWTEPKPMGEEINHHAHDGATYLSSDGKTLVLYYGDTRDLYQSKFTKGYKSQFMNGVWTKAEHMPEPINNVASWESSGCYSPDGQFFFFSSDRPEGYGELDIYMSKLGLDGKWGKPVNLGPEVNSPANEDAPFMHKDGTLYFGSEGLKGMGNYDIFKTKFKNNKWAKPENLGYPINTPEYDNYFHLSSDKKHGYFTSVRKDGVGNTDIYMATFPDEISIDSVTLAIKERADSISKLPVAAINKNAPDSVLAKNADKLDSLLEKNFVDPSIKAEFHVATEFRGKVIDEVDGKPLQAQIILVDNKMNKLLTRAHTNPKTGVFIIVIPHGGNYGVSASCDGYLFNSMNFDVPAFAESQTIETAILMSRAEVGSKSTLKNIFFDTGQSMLKNESTGELDRLVDLLERNPRLRVQINGHTDSNGDNATNKALSLKRAQSVVDYLIKKGIVDSRLKAVGYGEERPIVSNDDEQEGREINRRTEIEVVEITKP